MSSLSSAINSACFVRRSLCVLPSHKFQNGAFWCHQKKNKKQLSLCWALPFDFSPHLIDLDRLVNAAHTYSVSSRISSSSGFLYLAHKQSTCYIRTHSRKIAHSTSDFALVDIRRQCLFTKWKYRKMRKQILKPTMEKHWMQLTMVLRSWIFQITDELEGCDTVFVTPTARTIDISHAWVMKTAIMLVVSPMTCGRITEMLKKYIFFADKVEIQDITNQTSMFALLGPEGSKIMKCLGLGDLIGQPYGSHKHYSVGAMLLTVAVGSIISTEGFTFMMSPAAAKSVWKAFLGHGATPMSSSAWETLRVLRGRPAPGKELTDEFNVLEAGLWRAVSLNKGCYKGQETISRLVTYDGIKQRLWGIHLTSPMESSNIITIDGKKVGKLTSFTAGTKTSGAFGLGYIKRKAASQGDTVIVGNSIIGTLVEVPFLRDQHPPSKA